MNPELDNEKSGGNSPGSGASAVKILASGVVAIGILVAIAFLIRAGCRAPVDSAKELAHIPANEAGAFVDLAFKAADRCKEAFNFTPRIVRDTEVLVQESSPSLELATATRRLSVEVNYTNTWLGSAKSLSVRGIFLTKGGFDLRKKCELRVMESERKIVASFPNPQVLSVELLTHEIIKSEDGLWNKLRPEDQKTVLDALYAAARRRAAETVVSEAKKELERVVSEVTKTPNTRIEFKYGDAKPGPG